MWRCTSYTLESIYCMLTFDQCNLYDFFAVPRPALDTKPDLAAILSDITGKIASVNFKQAPKSKGTPRVLILSSSAKRSVELCKILNPICKESKAGKCGKFFGKHKDVKHQQFFLKQESFVYAVGTPARTSVLSESKMLKFGASMYTGEWLPTTTLYSEA